MQMLLASDRNDKFIQLSVQQTGQAKEVHHAVGEMIEACTRRPLHRRFVCMGTEHLTQVGQQCGPRAPMDDPVEPGDPFRQAIGALRRNTHRYRLAQPVEKVPDVVQHVVPTQKQERFSSRPAIFSPASGIRRGPSPPLARPRPRARPQRLRSTTPPARRRSHGEPVPYAPRQLAPPVPRRP